MNRKIFKILRSAILPVTTLAVGVLAGWYVGTARYARTIYRGLDEAKVCYYALTDTKGVLDPQTREYLKGRLLGKVSVRESRSGAIDRSLRVV